jgi:F-type H+-transporting ATPase subunit epsilon
MKEQLRVNLVTPSQDLAHTNVEQVTAPSVEGEVAILVDHIPLLAELKEGMIGLYQGSTTEFYAVSGGFIEVVNNTVNILAESAEAAENIDRKRSEQALKDSEAQLLTLDSMDEAYEDQQARYRRAQVRLAVAATRDH